MKIVFFSAICFSCLSISFSIPNKDKRAKIKDDITKVFNELNELQDEVNDLLPKEKNVKRSTEPTELAKGSVLANGESMVSPTSNRTPYYRAVMKNNGDFVVYEERYLDQTIRVEQWKTDTNGVNVKDGLRFQNDGNLVIYNTNNEAKWASHTANKGGTILKMQDDGRLVMYNDAGEFVWGTNFILPGHYLPVGHSLVNGRKYATMQPDGNFVLKNDKGQPMCSTRTHGNRNNLENGLYMQNSGNVRIRDSSGNALWKTGTGRSINPGNRLQLNTDGQIEVFTYSQGVYWTSKCDGVNIVKA